MIDPRYDTEHDACWMCDNWFEDSWYDEGGECRVEYVADPIFCGKCIPTPDAADIIEIMARRILSLETFRKYQWTYTANHIVLHPEAYK